FLGGLVSADHSQDGASRPPPSPDQVLDRGPEARAAWADDLDRRSRADCPGPRSSIRTGRNLGERGRPGCLPFLHIRAAAGPLVRKGDSRSVRAVPGRTSPPETLALA